MKSMTKQLVNGIFSMMKPKSFGFGYFYFYYYGNNIMN